MVLHISYNNNCNNSIKYYSVPAATYMFNVNNRNIRTRCEIYSKLTKKYILSFEHATARWGNADKKEHSN